MTSSERELASGFVLLVVICLIVIVYLTVRAVNHVVSVLARYPGATRPLWIALAAFACLLTAAVGSRSEALAYSTAAAGGVVVLVARWIELANAEAFQEPVSFASLQDDALHSPWWESNDDRQLFGRAA